MFKNFCHNNELINVKSYCNNEKRVPVTNIEPMCSSKCELPNINTFIWLLFAVISILLVFLFLIIILMCKKDCRSCGGTLKNVGVKFK